MRRTIVYFDDRLASISAENTVEGKTLTYLRQQLGPKETEVLGLGDNDSAEKYLKDPKNRPTLFICDHNIFFGEEPLLPGVYTFREGHQWMAYVRNLRRDLREVPIIIYTDDPRNAEYKWEWSPANVPFYACVAKYNYEGPKETRLKPWEILLQNILQSPPFIEGSGRVEERN